MIDHRTFDLGTAPPDLLAHVRECVPRTVETFGSHPAMFFFSMPGGELVGVRLGWSDGDEMKKALRAMDQLRELSGAVETVSVIEGRRASYTVENGSVTLGDDADSGDVLAVVRHGVDGTTRRGYFDYDEVGGRRLVGEWHEMEASEEFDGGIIADVSDAPFRSTSARKRMH